MLGCSLPGGEAGYNMARIVSELAGLHGVPGTTVNRYCASSVQTARMAFHAIRAGEGKAYVAAGVESVSRTLPGNPDGADGTRNPIFEGASQRAAAAAGGGWLDPADSGLMPNVYMPMGQTAENVAALCGITRDEQDAYAVRSQQRTAASAASGFWAREITPVATPDGRIVDVDDSPRPGTTIEALSALQPAFREKGTVTAGNSCPLNDGAAALIITSDTAARAWGLIPRARIVATSVSGLSPEIMGLGPVDASRTALDRAGMTIDDVDLVEINEAFAAQVLASAQRLGVPEDRLNVAGGAIALGHPFGMTGARITTTLLNAMETHDRHTGLVTMCVGGGQGMAMIVERMN
jgi:acetyl-CoA C-acetyltransferase